MKRDLLSAALYVAAFLPVCVCAALVALLIIPFVNYFDFRGIWATLLVALFPLAVAFGMYALLANWFRDEGWFRRGLRSHLIRSAPMYLSATYLLWFLIRYGKTLEEAVLFYDVLCGVSLAALASDIAASLRRPAAEASPARSAAAPNVPRFTP